MRQMRRAIREHLHFIVIVTLLTLVLTFPTIVYVFRTDVAWLPTGRSTDVFIKLWDIWYVKQILAGQADRFHTNQIFYPDGVSIVNHPISFLHAIVVNALKAVIPLTNAFNVAHLLIIWMSALSAYVYIHWLFRDKWVALFGAVVFGFSPVVLGKANHTEVSFVATIPLILYGFHRGVQEYRRSYIVAAGLLMGLTSISSLYGYVCAAITVGFAVVAFVFTRWRDKRFWRSVMLLLLTTAISSAWRLYPLMNSTEDLTAALSWHGEFEVRTDLVAYFVNPENPIIGQLADRLIQTASIASFSRISYIGYAPLFLVAIGLFNSGIRRKMLPWFALWIFFLTLRLGSVLQVNGIVYSQIVLPKYFLNKLLPPVFAPFHEADIILMGAALPLAIMTCYGIVALRSRLPSGFWLWVVLLLAGIVALEFYIPPKESIIHHSRLKHVHWLAGEDGSDEIRLINLPMGRSNSKHYNFYQVMHGYPHAEGAISRTPDSAFDYIRANPVMNAWHKGSYLSCEGESAEDYQSAIRALADDGFTHVVWHRHIGKGSTHDELNEGFLETVPSYSDESVSIYRLSDLRESCPT